MNTNPLQFFCKVRIAKILWRTPRQIPDSRLSYTQMLKNHRNFLNTNVSALFLPHLLANLVHEGLDLIHQAYVDAFYWLMECKLNNHVPRLEASLDQLIPLIFNSERGYSVEDFMTFEGKFDDVRWIQKFVRDELVSIDCRFNFACYYSLAEDMISIYRTTQWRPQIVNVTPLNLHVMTACNLNVNLEEHLHGFDLALHCNDVHAINYFWRKLSSAQKSQVLSNIGVVFNAIFAGEFASGHFLFNQLSSEKKKQLLRHDFGRNTPRSIILDSFLNPRCNPWQIVDLLNIYQDGVSSEIYSRLIRRIAASLTIYKTQIYRDVLKCVWNMCRSDRIHLDYAIAVLIGHDEMQCAEMLLSEVPLERRRTLISYNSVRGRLLHGSFDSIKKLISLLACVDAGTEMQVSLQFLAFIEQTVVGRPWRQSRLKTAVRELRSELNRRVNLEGSLVSSHEAACSICRVL